MLYRHGNLGKGLAVLICVGPWFTKWKIEVLMPQMLRSTHNPHKLHFIHFRAGGDYTVPVLLTL